MSENKKVENCCHHHEHDDHQGSCSCHHHEHDDHHGICSCHRHECDDHHHDDCCCGCVHEHGENYLLILLVRTILSVMLLIVSLFTPNIVTQIVLVSSYLVISYDVLYTAFKNIIKGKAFDENFLMSLASLTALIVPFFTDKTNIDPYDGILVIILYQIGEFLQHKAVDKSKKSITDMLDLNVERVTISVDGEYHEISVFEVKIGDVIVVKPGDSLVVDGVVESGSSTLNTAVLTGESLPREVYSGSEVLSGCTNNDGLLYVRATSTFNDSTTAKVKEIVEKANQNKAKLDRFFTRFARVYTPVVIAISVIIMFVLPLILGFEKYFLTFLYKGLAIMVISCPCALVISIPLAYFMGIGKAARNQILVKGASYLEALSEVNAVLFDKTGTLTKGEFVVLKEESTNQELMYKILYSCEKNFSHAIAKSISKYLEGKTSEVEIDDIVNVPGYGVKASYNDKEVLIGNAKLLNENNIKFVKVDTDRTVVYVSYDSEFIGYLVIADEIKNDAIKTINNLIKEYEIHIISGDKKECVVQVADQLNIKNYHYELLPKDKVELLNKVKKDKSVLYVGDGINDAACLIGATVGMAMRAIGSDVAVNASDIVLMDDNLDSINKAIKISKKTKKIVISNIIFSLSVKVLIMLCAIFFNIPMYVAIISDVGVAMLAVLNSLRIMYFKLD